MRKLKLIGVQIVTFICFLLFLPLNSYEPNAVEAQLSSVSYDELDSRGYKGLKIEITPTPIDNEETRIETPVAGISLYKITNDVKPYTQEDLDLLAGIIENEAGGNFCSNKHQRAVCSVVINRVKSDYFPNTIKEVIFQDDPKQYDIRMERFNHPSKRAYKNAKYVLEHGSTLPDNCIFQSEYKQGDGVYGKPYKTPISTTYICYKD